MIILYSDTNNDLKMVFPTQEGIQKFGLDGLIKRDIPEDATNILIVDKKVLENKDRYFRGAWDLDEISGIVININKAKEIHLNNLKNTRNKKLEELDRKSIRFISNISILQSIEKEKEVLRDLPEKIVAEMRDMDDLEAIKNYIPEELN